jgi:hypothetical protein
MALAQETRSTDPTSSANTPAGSGRAFDEPADEATIERTAAALRTKGYEVHIVDDYQTAKALLLSFVPEGAEVSEGASRTLDELGVTAAIEEPGRYDNVRVKTRAMDRSDPIALREMRKMGVAPDYWLNSAHAVTEDGRIVVASNSGSQLGAIAFGAGQVIFAIGSQKIVPDLETALRRIDTYVLPLESARMQGIYGIDSAVNKVLIVNKEFRAGRFTVVLIREPIGF